MKHTFWLPLSVPLALASLAYASSAYAGETKGWENFATKENGFSVLMPGKPMESRQSVKSGVGQLEVTSFFADDGKDAAVVVSVTVYPEAGLKGGVDQQLDAARDGAVSSAKGKLKSEKKIALNNHPGRELLIESDTRGSIRTRIYLVERRLYQTMAIGTKTYVNSKEVTTFLDSFKLIK